MAEDFVNIKVGNEVLTWYLTKEEAKILEEKKKSLKQEQVVPVVENTGMKFDAGKNRLELIPPEAIWGLGEILTFGATKYSDRNWEKGMKWSRVFGAAMRHLWKWWWTKKPDDETGYSHLKHALCCVAFLIAYEERKIGEDDRP